MSLLLLGMVLCQGVAFSSQDPLKPVLNGFVEQTLNQADDGIVGLEMLIRPQSYPIIQHVFPGSPAEKVGFQAGDILLSVNGTSTWGQSLQTVDELIPNVPGLEVRFVYAHHSRVTETTLRVAALHEVSPALRSFYQPALTNNR